MGKLLESQYVSESDFVIVRPLPLHLVSCAAQWRKSRNRVVSFFRNVSTFWRATVHIS